MNQRENFISARDNEVDEKYLGTEWDRFRDFDIVEKTEDNVLVCAKWRDPGLPRPRKLREGETVQTYTGEWLLKDDNSRVPYAPLRDEPDLFVKFADLASKDRGTRDGRYETMLDWIRKYGVLGLLPEGHSGMRSKRHEDLLLFWSEVHRAARCMALYEAATGPGRLLKRSSLPGKTLAEKRKEAVLRLVGEVGNTLERYCYPKLYPVCEDTGEKVGVTLSWGFRSLLGAMYLQLAWRIKSRQCAAPGCNTIIGLHERSDKVVCSDACAERRRYHRPKSMTV
jgi:hypothetical protein